VDYVSVALGESSTYLGSVGIVPPPPTAENAIAEHAAPFRVGPPLVATSRIVNPSEADGLVAGGVADAVGMTRALITDPDLPRKVVEGRLEDVLRCIGCNACIAHYHAGTGIACAQNPRTGRERTLPRPEPGERRRVVVVGGGPAGLAAAAEACASGHEAILLERGDRLGGQLELARGTPMHAELAASLARNYARLLAGAEIRLDTQADAALVAVLEPDLAVVATGARPFLPDRELDGIDTCHAWDVLAGPVPEAGRVVVADWGGDPSGLAAAELLAAAGAEVTLALGSAAFGETLHAYQRNLYAQRLYRAGVRVEQHLDLVSAGPEGVRFRNLFARELETTVPADLLVLALGRVPERGLAEELAAAGITVAEAGDCLGPRGIEEAILEGTLAVAGLGNSKIRP
jgi:NADPH-dependent 2,4-dienoyl-CoA reductase/sulfur reductase-like enzyme